MTKLDLCNLLIRNAKEYKELGVIESIKRNSHMNDYDGEQIKETTSDAILVDFINFIAANQGIDLGLYTKDLKE